MPAMKPYRLLPTLLALLAAGSAWSQPGPVYRCPGPPVLYTDALSAQDAKERNCRTIENAPITIVQPPKPRPVAVTTRPPTPRSADQKVEPSEQRERDSDARRILEAELKKEEERLEELKREYNNGEPERRGEERNYQRYLDRVADMKAGIERKEDDIAAIKRELAKLPAP
jgi:hypothetical protein